MQEGLQGLLPNRADDALQAELQAIRGAFQANAQALTELQALVAQVLAALQSPRQSVPKTNQLVPDDLAKFERWYRDLLAEFGPANDAVIVREIERLKAQVLSGAPFPSRPEMYLHQRIEQGIGSRLMPTPGVPKLSVLEEDDGDVDEEQEV